MSRSSLDRASARMIFVVKIGGALIGERGVDGRVWDEIEAMRAAGQDVVLLHGGGGYASDVARRLGHTPRMVHGRRVTSDLDLEIVQWTLRGAINARLVAQALGRGLPAVGVSGIDAQAVQVVRRPPRNVDGEQVDFGWVGDVTGVDVTLLDTLLADGRLPVMAPLGVDETGQIYNVNADTVALETAAALGADRLLLVAEAGGVYRDLSRPETKLASVDPATLEVGRAEGWIAGGMRVKLDVAVQALEAGVSEVYICGPTDLSEPERGTRVGGKDEGLRMKGAGGREQGEGSREQGEGGRVKGVGDSSRGGSSSGAASQIPNPKSQIINPKSRVVGLHRSLVRIPSLSREEREVADFVEAYVREHGIEPKRVDDNVYFSLGSGSRRLLLATHLDVVPPSESHPFPPFEAVQHEGKVYGRGSVDAKGCAAAMTRALLDLAQSGWTPADGEVIVALTTCEEIGGTYNGLQTLRGHLGPLDAALVGEPTQLQPCVAQKGLLILNVTAHGKTAHAARAHLGENALYMAARDLQRIEAFTFERDHPLLGWPTVAATTIAGGTARNVIPDAVTFTLDIRSTPAYTHEELIGLFSNALESEVTVRSKRIIPVGTALDDPIVSACRHALPGAAPFASPTASDWIFLSDVPAVKIGPGRSELSHTPEEHIDIAELERGVEVYRDVIQAFFDGG
ncbi:MAG: acetylglutamate kinase [Bacteroidota bacterium]